MKFVCYAFIYIYTDANVRKKIDIYVLHKWKNEKILANP